MSIGQWMLYLQNIKGKDYSVAVESCPIAFTTLTTSVDGALHSEANVLKKKVGDCLLSEIII